MMVKHALDSVSSEIEVTKEAEDAWIALCQKAPPMMIGATECTFGYYNNEGKGWDDGSGIIAATGYPAGPVDDHFDHCFYSCEVGFRKPDLAYFEAIMNRLALSAGECLFIDDSEANVESARTAGLVSVQYKFRSLSGAKGELDAIVERQLNDR